MKRGTITIDGKGNVHISSTPVWMSACEIADLLGVFSGKVNGQIKAIFKEGLLMETETVRRIRSEQGFVDLYSIEMITILSFRIATPQAKTLRRWIIDRLTEKNSSTSPMIVCYTLGKRYN
ncbi:hypothetical protein [Alloprevotella rava]|nr:hypothetical protein [Alloprevotella rava]